MLLLELSERDKDFKSGDIPNNRGWPDSPQPSGGGGGGSIGLMSFNPKQHLA